MVDNGTPQRRISRGIVAIYMEHLGRGPARATTTITEDYVATLCEGSLSKAETKLRDSGREDTVRSIRRTFQMAMAEDMTKLVEGETGRRCRSLLSDHDVASDVAIEMLVLEPRSQADVPQTGDARQ